MLKKIQKIVFGMAVPILLLTSTQGGLASLPDGTASAYSGQQSTDLQGRVRHSILMLPYYGVFDRLDFSIEGNTVTLTGDVRRAALKDEAEWVVRKTAGVERVINNIEILPLSLMDDSLRLRAYRAIFSEPGFEKYRIQVAKPIRIIVRNGNITLYGMVATKLDKQVAMLAVRNVPFAFSVTDNLQVG